MTTMINIQTTADNTTLEAIKALLFKIDPTAIFETYGEHQNYLSKEDEEHLKMISDMDDKGELEYVTMDKMNAHVNSLFKNTVPKCRKFLI